MTRRDSPPHPSAPSNVTPAPVTTAPTFKPTAAASFPLVPRRQGRLRFPSPGAAGGGREASLARLARPGRVLPPAGPDPQAAAPTPSLSNGSRPPGQSAARSVTAGNPEAEGALPRPLRGGGGRDGVEWGGRGGRPPAPSLRGHRAPPRRAATVAPKHPPHRPAPLSPYYPPPLPRPSTAFRPTAALRLLPAGASARARSGGGVRRGRGLLSGVWRSQRAAGRGAGAAGVSG